MTEPTQCALWLKPELAEPLKDRFNLVETYVEEAHWWRYLLECRECGQLYFFEFYEQIDWEGGVKMTLGIGLIVATTGVLDALRQPEVSLRASA